jgi:hypothetical protein
MHTFLSTVQAVFNKEFENKIPIRYLDGTIEKQFDFYREQYENELLLPPEKRRGVEKQFFLIFISSGNVSIKARLRFFKDTCENIFMNENMREIFMKRFVKIQNTYRVLSKFAYRCKHKITKTFINKDVYLNTLDENGPRVFSVIQNKKKYLFSITDLVNILNTSLGNTFFFVSEPLPCKNPYTNMPFDKSTLYNIYFFIRKTGFIMPPLFHQYFLSNFNLCRFADENEDLIRDYSIKEYVNNAETEELYSEITSMLQADKPGRKIKIDIGFPKEKLVDIMRPYLELYYKGTHTQDEIKRERYADDYYYKIKRFHEHNKQFGRRFLSKVSLGGNPFEKKYKYTESFNDKHINFCDAEPKDEFLTSHIHVSANGHRD